ncbi:MAG: thioredoxin family protein [Methylophaga sp.]|nr:MAG: thioredoxin family protein [Methylophaga sp.]
MTVITLFTTVGCHLCEQAEAILNAIDAQIVSIEIGDDDDLVAHYGTSIPVLKFADNSELNWPFELKEIERKINQLI